MRILVQIDDEISMVKVENESGLSFSLFIDNNKIKLSLSATLVTFFGNIFLIVFTYRNKI